MQTYENQSQYFTGNPNLSSSKKRNQSKTKNHNIVAITLAVGIILMLVWILACQISESRWDAIDDSFITYVYSRNLAEGHGIRYNSTDIEPTEGSSSLLHVFILALAFKLDIDPLTATRGLSLVFFLTVPFVVGLAFSRFGKLPLGIGLLAAAVVYIGFSFLRETRWHITLGMDTILFLGVHTWVFAWAVTSISDLHQRPGFKGALIGILLMTLLTLCRPEGMLLSLLYILAIAIVRMLDLKTIGVWRKIKPIFFILICFMSVVGVIMVWKWIYFGYLVPNSYYVKSNNSIFGSSGALFPGFKEVGEFLIRRYFPLALLSFGIAIWLKKGRQILRCFFLLLPSMVVIMLYSRAIHENAFGFRYEYPLLIPLTGCLVLCAGSVWIRSSKVFSWLMILAVLIAPLFGFYQHSLRFASMSKWISTPIRSAIEWIGYSYETGTKIHPLAKMGLDLGETRLRQQASILLSGAGMVAYYSGYKAIDWIGLNNNYLSGRISRNLDEVWWYIDSHKPDVIYSLLPPATPGITSKDEDPAFKSIAVQNFLKGKKGSNLFLYWNNDIVAEMFYREMRYIRNHYIFSACYDLGEDWKLLAYVRTDSPFLERIQNVLGQSKRTNWDEDLTGLFVNDPRSLTRDNTNEWNKDR